jgi:GTP-binding protein
MDQEVDPSQFSEQISELALLSALNALQFAQVVLVVVESSQGKFSKIDLQLARKCLEEGRAVVIAANKSDLLFKNYNNISSSSNSKNNENEDEKRSISAKEFEENVKSHAEDFFKEFGDVPVVSCSGLRKKNIPRILDTVLKTHDAWSRRIDTWLLNAWLKDLMVTSPAPRVGKKSINIKYITQVKTRPPSFAIFTNVVKLPLFFERFLRFKIQSNFNLCGIPIRFVIRKTKGKEVKKNLLNLGKQARRGVGRGEGRGVGKKRKMSNFKRKVKISQDLRRRRVKRVKRN